MPRIPLSLAFASVTALLMFSASAFAQSTIEGVWRTQQGTEVTIAPCGNAFCGYITSVVVPDEIMAANREALASMDPSEYFDANNEDPSLRSRPILGLEILRLRGRNPERLEGTIYNPEDGKTYEGTFELTGDDSAILTGCGLFGMICRDERWERIALPPVPEEEMVDPQEVAEE